MPCKHWQLKKTDKAMLISDKMYFMVKLLILHLALHNIKRKNPQISSRRYTNHEFIIM